tara:strand:- start:517 stop:1287 length:771 start_codon:yes stop_codon:yes gene_type:complete
MVSVLQVYTALKDLANKEQKGFITPRVFNSFAAMAQLNIYNELFTELVDAKRLSRQNFDPGRDKSIRKQKEEDLSLYFRRKNSYNDLVYSNGFLEKPFDFSKLISIQTGTPLGPNQTLSGGQEVITCEIVYDPEKLDRIVGSNLSSPTEKFPVALVSPVDIEIFPSSVNFVIMSYYAKPTSFDSDGQISSDPPYYDFTVYNYTGENVEAFDAKKSRDFMLPSHCLNEVVMEMAKLIGVRLRDGSVSVFATQEEASE